MHKRANATPLEIIFTAANGVESRSVAGRLSGEDEYRPLRRSAPGEGFQSDDRDKILEAARAAHERSATVPIVQALHANGVGRLLLDDVDGAVAILERAVVAESETHDLDAAVTRARSANLLNDLACAYLARAYRGRRDSDFLRSLSAAEHSWLLEKTAASAWNRALVYEALSLKGEASRAWRDVLALEETDGWREEAALRDQALNFPTDASRWRRDEASFVAALAMGDREHLKMYGGQYAPRLFGTALHRITQWAACVRKGDSACAAAALREARLLGDALFPADPFVADAVATIDTATRDSEWTAELARGVSMLDEGRRLYDERRLDEALAILRSAATILADARSNLVTAAQIRTAACLVVAQRYPEAYAEIARVTADATIRHRYVGAFAQANWIAGLALLATGKPYEALEAYATAWEIFERSHDTASLAAIADLQGEVYEHLGMAEESWRYRRLALALNAASGATNRSDIIFGGAARAAIKLNQYSVALRFVDAVVPERRDQPAALAELLVLRGAIRDDLGLQDAATEDFRGAGTALARVPPGAAQEAVANDIRAVQLLIGARTNVEAADAAIATATKHDNQFRRVPLLRKRAAANPTDATSAMEAAGTALSEMERQLSTVYDADIRLTAQRSLRDLYESLVTASIARGDVKRAVELLDCQREHNRLDHPTTPCATVPFNEIPEEVAWLDYAVVRDTMLVFSVYRGTVTAHRIPASPSSIEENARELANAIRGGDDERARSAGADLAANLFDPFVDEFRGATMIVVGGGPATVPIPFAALWSRRTGHFLVEDWTITYASGISRLASAVRRDRQLRALTRPEIELFVVAPQYTSRSELPPLPSAAAEANTIRGMYGRAVEATGETATLESFRRIAPNAAFLHFAGHSIVNAEQPRYSALALTGADGHDRPDMLYAEEIATMDLPATRLVILASCASASAGNGTSVTPTSLSDAFSDAHVPGVVGTMWAVDDRDTTHLLTQFHEQLRVGRAAPDALRRAQIAALHSGDTRRSHIQQWAPYCFIGWHTGTEEKAWPQK